MLFIAFGLTVMFIELEFGFFSRLVFGLMCGVLYLLSSKEEVVVSKKAEAGPEHVLTAISIHHYEKMFIQTKMLMRESDSKKEYTPTELHLINNELLKLKNQIKDVEFSPKQLKYINSNCL